MYLDEMASNFEQNALSFGTHIVRIFNHPAIKKISKEKKLFIF